MIVRQISYVSGGNAVNNLCQVYSNLVDDLVLAVFPVFSNLDFADFPNYFTNNLDTHFKMYRKFQNGSANFQVQLVPANPTVAGIPGPLVPNTVAGVVNLALEFVQYESQ
ncbi:MAG TPA: hypothetical protein VHD33_02540 [Legionellaceae bacterium]|nr:hypothetical protein [Legionellaceae bacterium]